VVSLDVRDHLRIDPGKPAPVALLCGIYDRCSASPDLQGKLAHTAAGVAYFLLFL
jgi:hypothetical protein